jgi:hypothetical protein
MIEAWKKRQWCDGNRSSCINPPALRFGNFGEGDRLNSRSGRETESLRYLGKTLITLEDRVTVRRRLAPWESVTPNPLVVKIVKSQIAYCFPPSAGGVVLRNPAEIEFISLIMK